MRLLILTILLIFLLVWFCNIFSKKYVIKKSKINGIGIFANKNIKKNELIDIAFTIFINENNLKDSIISYFGSKINHCTINDNSYLKKSGNDYYLYAKKNIKKGEEITSNYYNTPDIIEKPNKSYKKC